MSELKILAMATFPPRREGLIKVVQKLLPQCDRFYAYLNNYTEIPAELPVDDKLVCVLAGPGTGNPDLGSQGKFFWCGKDDGYYLTVDDDIHYPDGYVDYMVHQVERYGRKAIVGLHGGIFRVRMGGGFPPQGFAKDHRTLYPYDRRVPRDMPVHILGAGVMACYPRAIGLSYEACHGPIHSGDDEDIAIWSQKNKIPLVRLQGRDKWLTPDDRVWVKDPLHRRTGYMNAADQKIKSWNTWFVHSLPPAGPDNSSLAAAVVSLPVTLAHRKNGPSFSDIVLNKEDLDYCNRVISSDSFAAIIVDRIKKKIPTSAIRMSDGERAFILHAKGGPLAPFMMDRVWLQRYGLTGADLKKVGMDLMEAGHQADFLALTISGLFFPQFKIHHLFQDRKGPLIDQFFPALWAATDRVGAVLRAGSVLVLHREHARLVPVLKKKYGLDKVSGMILNSWGDHERLLQQIPEVGADLILVSGGASGKPFCCRGSQTCGGCWLDVGEALTGIWCK